MNFKITKKICIEIDDKIIAAYDACSVERVYVPNKESGEIFKVMKSGGKYNLVKIFDSGAIRETDFKHCKAISDFDEDFMAKVFFYDMNRGKISHNYIGTDLKLLFEKDKYVEVEKVSGGKFNTKFIVAINKVSEEGASSRQKKFYGVVNKNGLEILECKYSSITYNPKTDTFDTTI